MFDTIRAKYREYKSFILALLFPAADLIVKTTMFGVFRLFGIQRDKILIKHAEVYLIATTFTLIILPLVSILYPIVGWVTVVIGTLRILQIVAVDFLFIYFNFHMFSKSVHDRDRARWHFVAFSFTVVDLVIIYSFYYYFFNRLYGILNTKALNVIDYLYLSAATLTTLGANSITPVRALGKILMISEVGMGIFLFAIIINAAMIHHHHLYESLEK